MSENTTNENCSVEQEKVETKKECKKSKDSKIVEQLKAELAEKNEILLRTAAEFDNFKKRTEKERLEIYERASVSTLKNILPVLDNVDRANSVDKESADYAKGIELIVKQLSDLTAKLGLVTIGEVGEPFDPQFHEAVMHIDDENFAENTIAMVLQKGYKFGNTVIRPAMVQVAN